MHGETSDEEKGSSIDYESAVEETIIENPNGELELIDNNEQENKMTVELSKMLLRSVPLFTGEETEPLRTVSDFQTELEQVFEVAKYKATDTAAKLLTAKSRIAPNSTAQRVIESDDDLRKAATYEEFIQLLKSRFKHLEEHHGTRMQNLFQNTRQESGESVLDYFTKVKSRARHAFHLGQDANNQQVRKDLMDSQLKIFFQLGLKPSLREEVIKQAPKSLQESLDLAIKLENIQKLNRSQEKPEIFQISSTSTNQTGENESVIMLAISKMQEEIEQMKTNQTASKQPRPYFRPRTPLGYAPRNPNFGAAENSFQSRNVYPRFRQPPPHQDFQGYNRYPFQNSYWRTPRPPVNRFPGNRPNSPRTVCPYCQRGFHWMSECRYKQQMEGTGTRNFYANDYSQNRNNSKNY